MRSFKIKKYIRDAFKKKHKQEHYMSSDLYADYLEIKICSIFNFFEERERKVPKTEFNRKGFPVSIIDCVKNSTKRTMLKKIKEKIISQSIK